MYFVVMTDHVNQINNVIYKTVYVDDAAQICEIEAADMVVCKEGIKYLDSFKTNLSLRKRHKFLPVGYSVVKSKSHLPRYTVFHKGENGIILHGAIKKLYTFHVIKCSVGFDEKRVSEMGNVERADFDAVLYELTKKKPEVD
jgi:hypothetical protein